MKRPRRLQVCPHCACHAKPVEDQCPCCGASLRVRDGVIVPAAAIVMMGLTAVTCSDDETGPSTSMTKGSSSASMSASTDSVVSGSLHSNTGGFANVGGGDDGGGGAGGMGGSAGGGG